MAYSCRVLADSIAPHGQRLTTMEATYPRIVHAEMMTYRVKSRNAGSNRAIPVSKLIHAVEADPFMPLSWGKNQRGMQMGEQFTPEEEAAFNRLWLRARTFNVRVVKRFEKAGVHKSIPNRLLEPWQWITLIISSTEWGNFYNQRIDGDAEQHIYRIADMMWEAQAASKPVLMQTGDWHLPLVSDEDRQQFPDTYTLRKLSAARCARVSYLTHQGERLPAEDFRLHDDLVKGGHWSPFEHQATPALRRGYGPQTGNFKGWNQYRKQFANENRHIYIRE